MTGSRKTLSRPSARQEPQNFLFLSSRAFPNRASMRSGARTVWDVARLWRSEDLVDTHPPPNLAGSSLSEGYELETKRGPNGVRIQRVSPKGTHNRVNSEFRMVLPKGIEPLTSALPT